MGCDEAKTGAEIDGTVKQRSASGKGMNCCASASEEINTKDVR